MTPFEHRDRRPGGAIGILALLIGAAATTSQPHAQPAPSLATSAEGTEWYLEVTLNQTRVGGLTPFVQRNGKLFARASDLRTLGFVLMDIHADALVDLADLPGLTTQLDTRLQRVVLTAPLRLLALETTRLEANRSTSATPSPTAPGVLFNYDLYTAHDRGGSQLSAAHETRLFGIGEGVYSNTMITRLLRTDTGAPGDGWESQSVRLDTSWEKSWPDRLLSLQLGDSVTRSLDWTRSVRIGGVRIGSNFALEPYRLTTPQPAFFGEVTVPSAVDLYVNGLKQYSGQVPAGPFQLNANPGISGAGNAQVVLTDAFGRSRTLSLPFYNTQRLLETGLTDWSASLGVVRLGYGQRSFAYDHSPVASATVRHGVSDRWTVEAHAEGSGQVRNTGIGASWLLGNAGTAGVLSASIAASAGAAQRGAQGSLGYQWSHDNLFFEMNTQRTRGHYRDIASRYGQDPARISDRATGGMTFPAIGSFGLSYIRLTYPGSDDSRYAGISWSRQLGNRLTLSASLTQQLNDRKNLNAFFGLSYSLDGRLNASATLQRGEGRTRASVDVTQPVPGDGGWGWRAQASDDGGTRGGQIEAGWLGRYGRANLGAANFAGNSASYASASGSLVLMNSGFFAARDVSDGFALVTTDGIAGVPVKLENRVVGVTDDRGTLLVTRLNAWQRNRLSIDPMNLPANTQVLEVDKNATPADRAGTIVRFAIRPVRAALIVLHDTTGQAMALGSRVQNANGSGARAVVGYDGETYLDTLQMHNRLRVFPAATATPCIVEFDLPDADGATPRVGPLRCVPEEAPP
ncbi:fimbria/pilus outer membrane usher protein [Variovorax sp. PAMC 28711]|uniref:fimbria/pilus outer membrane usher protein n=1 Tax=Variovorax sp. PAMC 28711 TaxID=1795631 RepID=UPI00078E6CC2|nr:fimbria/pilus outer membrane usher protein [Variovorax sp. PAMC 28711]AMM24256.1 hypothetical protein AX767_07770 [Variovorax sp. PAMC 28711]